MNILGIVNNPWAILPAKLQEIQNIYSRHVAGATLSEVDMQAAIGGAAKTKQTGFRVQDGVAVVSIDGVIAKRMNMMTQISGGTSSEMAAGEIQQAARDPNIKGIILAIDSPGGTVDGTQRLAQIVDWASGIKPVVAWADGMMASAAYWIGCAAGSVYLSSDTTIVGSIGVVAQHVDYSGREHAMGLKTTEIYAGKYKRIATGFAALSVEGKAYMQDQVDVLYSVFLNEVARYRNVSTEKTLAMADGRIFIGKHAVDVGLADGIASLNDLIASVAGN